MDHLQTDVLEPGYGAVCDAAAGEDNPGDCAVEDVSQTVEVDECGTGVEVVGGVENVGVVPRVFVWGLGGWWWWGWYWR